MPQETPAFKHLTDDDINYARHHEAMPLEGVETDLLRLHEQESINPDLWTDELSQRRQEAHYDAERLAISGAPDVRVEVPGVEAMPVPEMFPTFMDAYANTLTDVRARAVASGKVGDTTVLGYAGHEGTAFEQQNNTPMAA